MSKVRTQIYITEKQHQMLSNLSNRIKRPVAAMVREAIDEYLSKVSSRESINPLSQIIALGESDSALGSVRHDEEIYDD